MKTSQERQAWDDLKILQHTDMNEEAQKTVEGAIMTLRIYATAPRKKLNNTTGASRPASHAQGEDSSPQWGSACHR